LLLNEIVVLAGQTLWENREVMTLERKGLVRCGQAADEEEGSVR
jgi:hypothetical protein